MDEMDAVDAGSRGRGDAKCMRWMHRKRGHSHTVDMVDAADGGLGGCDGVVDMVDVVSKGSLVVLWSHSIHEYQFFLTKKSVI